MDDKHTLKMPGKQAQQMKDDDHADGRGLAAKEFAAAAPKPDPKPVPLPPNVKKAEGITYIGKYKKYQAEFKASGQTYNCGLHDTEAQAATAMATAKARLYA